MTFFNDNRKQEFLNMYPGSTQHVYKRIFAKSAETESKFNKDLFDFELELIDDILYDLNPLTPTISQTNGRIISAYINWAIDKGYKKGSINILASVTPEYFTKFVDKTKKIYFSYDEIMDAERFCENAQDAVVIRLLFESVNGKESWEIRNLRNEDGMIDWDNNRLTLEDKDGSTRTIEVSERCMYLIEEALGESTYLKRNGMMEERENVREFNDLMDNNYVVRNSITKSTNTNGAVNEWVVYRRVTLIGELYGIPYFTTKNIVRSGMIYMAYKILLDNNKRDMSKEDYVEIAQRYKVKNWYTLKEYVNLDIIESLYGEINNKVNSPA
jgi:hypothetical protein